MNPTWVGEHSANVYINILYIYICLFIYIYIYVFICIYLYIDTHYHTWCSWPGCSTRRQGFDQHLLKPNLLHFAVFRGARCGCRCGGGEWWIVAWPRGRKYVGKSGIYADWCMNNRDFMGFDGVSWDLSRSRTTWVCLRIDRYTHEIALGR